MIVLEYPGVWIYAVSIGLVYINQEGIICVPKISIRLRLEQTLSNDIFIYPETLRGIDYSYGSKYLVELAK